MFKMNLKIWIINKLLNINEKESGETQKKKISETKDKLDKKDQYLKLV